MRLMRGLTASSLRSHPSLMPLFACVTLGMVGSGLYLLRLAVRSPDVCWDKKNNPYPWQKMSPKDQYKFYSPSVDYSKLAYPKERPELNGS